MNKQYCTFYLNANYFGIDINYIQEVIKQQKLTSVPLSEKTVRGLINLRGEIIVSINSWKLLELAKEEIIDDKMSVIIKGVNGKVSLAVDKIDEIVEVNDGKLESVPNNVNPNIKKYLKHVCQCNDKLMLILNTEQL